MDWNYIANVALGAFLIVAGVSIFATVESHAQDLERARRQRRREAECEALRAAAVKNDSLDVVV